MIRVSINTEQLRRKARALRAAINSETERALRGLAQEAIRERFEDQDDFNWNRGAGYHRWNMLGAVFIPVRLLHKRREAWPDLAPIYQARVTRKQSTYRGREKFYVDEAKLSAFRAKLEAKAVAGLSPGQWDFFITRQDFKLIVTVKKKGRARKGDAAAAQKLAARLKERFAEHGSEILARAFKGAGF